MNIVHPQQAVNNLSPEDVFYAVDDMGTQMGYGYIMYQLQPGIYPDCPVNMFFSIEGQMSARYMLLGAIVARARVLQNVNPGVKARLYTSMDPGDTDQQDFYQHNGFDLNGADCTLALEMPFGDGRIPMSCSVSPIPLNTYDEQSYLISRLEMNEITFVDRNYLNRLQHMPHFMTLGLYRNTYLIGEVMMAGQGSECELIAIYIEPGSRNQGMARALLHRMMAIMAAEGVSRITTRIMTRSIPQQRLMAAFNAQVTNVNMVFPEMILT